MKAAALILLFVCYVQCRKLVPINKNANIDFINMESGGRPGPGPMRPGAPVAPAPAAPTKAPAPAVANPPSPTPAPAAKPVVQPVAQPAAQPAVQPTPKPVAQPVAPQPQKSTPSQIKPVPVNPPPSNNPITTPGYGSVKQLINFYDSQGKASPVRPYSYSEAVKKGK